MANKEPSRKDISDIAKEQEIDPQTQISPKTGLSFDYMNTLYSRLLIISTTSEKNYSHLQEPLPTYTEYCSNQENKNTLIKQAKQEHLTLHNFFVKQFNTESPDVKKSKKAIKQYIKSFNRVISGNYTQKL